MPKNLASFIGLIIAVGCVLVFFISAAVWARQRNKAYKDPAQRSKMSGTQKIFFKDMPRKFYDSGWFLAGMIFSTIILLSIYGKFRYG